MKIGFIGIAVTILSWFLIRPRKWWQRILIIACGVTLTVALVISPVKDLFITYNTPEDAFIDTAEGEVVLRVDGGYTSLVVAKHDEGLSESIIRAVDGGWKAGTAFDMRIYYWYPALEYSLTVLRYKDTDEFYIYLEDVKGEIKDIKDNRHSYFSVYQTDENDNIDINKLYVAYVHDLDEEYILYIDGIKHKCVYS